METGGQQFNLDMGNHWMCSSLINRSFKAQLKAEIGMGHLSAFFPTVDPIFAQIEPTGPSVTPRMLLFPRASISSGSPHAQLKRFTAHRHTSDNFRYFTDAC